jgi:UDP-hydrolysing UDP-N-acetyl-D-glucosamine 2-epimerase
VTEPHPGTRRVALVTTARSDLSILRPVRDAIERHGDLDPIVIAAGTHADGMAGGRALLAEAGIEPAAWVPFLTAEDRPVDIARSMGTALSGFAEALDDLRPDVVVLVGDRYETHSAAAAAVPLRIPIAHLHGGELSFGAIDERFRHSITKLADLHFVSTESYAARLRQMGERPDRIVVSGAPALDLVRSLPRLGLDELARRLDVTPDALGSALLVTFHPATAALTTAAEEADELVAALAGTDRPVIVTLPNRDPAGSQVRARLEELARRHPDRVRLHEELGAVGYFSAMAACAAMVGNSSSGIIEAASFGLPVVNVGSRQDGRVRGANVIDVPARRQAIADAIALATDARTRERVRTEPNPYDRGGASALIAATLAGVDLIQLGGPKPFYDLPTGT